MTTLDHTALLLVQTLDHAVLLLVQTLDHTALLLMQTLNHSALLLVQTLSHTALLLMSKGHTLRSYGPPPSCGSLRPEFRTGAGCLIRTSMACCMMEWTVMAEERLATLKAAMRRKGVVLEKGDCNFL